MTKVEQTEPFPRICNQAFRRPKNPTTKKFTSAPRITIQLRYVLWLAKEEGEEEQWALDFSPPVPCIPASGLFQFLGFLTLFDVAHVPAQEAYGVHIYQVIFVIKSSRNAMFPRNSVKQ